MRLIFLGIFVFFSISFDLSSIVQAQFICGSTNVFAKNNEWMKEFAQSYGLASILGNTEVQCGITGENFLVCRKCQTQLKSNQFDLIRQMLGSEKYKRWYSKWRSQVEAEAVKITAVKFEEEKKMGHVRTAETRGGFDSRINKNWGESFLFTHREVYKMIQLELTMSGQPCLGPLNAIPDAIDDKDWPAPKGKSESEALRKIKEELTELRSPQQLKKMSLNELGESLKKISTRLYQVYRDSDEVISEKCQNNESSKSECDDLQSVSHRTSNKYFWMIHSHLDSFVESWLTAHDKQSISKDCSGKQSCYQWEGTYSGNYPY